MWKEKTEEKEAWKKEIMDSVCVTWLEHEDRYLVTFLPRDGSPLLKQYVSNMQEFITLLQAVEAENATKY